MQCHGAVNLRTEDMFDHPLRDKMGHGPVCRATYLQHDQVALALLELHLLFKSGAKGIKRVSYPSDISTNSLRSKWQ